MAEPSSNTKSQTWAMVLPPFGVLLLFGVYLGMNGLPHAKEMKQAETELAAARAAAVSDAEVARLQQELKDAQAKLAEAKAKLVERQEESRIYVGSQVSATSKLDLMNEVHGCFDRANLAVTIEKAHSSQGDVALTGHMRKAASELLTVIQKTAASLEGPKPPANPALMSPEEFQAQQMGLTSVAQVTAPAPRLREVEVHGRYTDMLAALREICTDCGHTTVVSVSLEPELSRTALSGRLDDSSPARRDIGTLRRWTLLVNVQPTPGRRPLSSQDKIALEQSGVR